MQLALHLVWGVDVTDVDHVQPAVWDSGISGLFRHIPDPTRAFLAPRFAPYILMMLSIISQAVPHLMRARSRYSKLDEYYAYTLLKRDRHVIRMEALWSDLLCKIECQITLLPWPLSRPPIQRTFSETGLNDVFAGSWFSTVSDGALPRWSEQSAWSMSRPPVQHASVLKL